MKLNWPHESMMRRVMMLGVVAAKILNFRPPVYDELALVGPVLNIIKTHIYCLRSFLFDLFVGKSDGSGVVYLHRGCCLGMSHLFK